MLGPCGPTVRPHRKGLPGNSLGTSDNGRMSADLHALRFLLLIFAGWVNRHQQRVIEYLLEENRVLKEQMGKRRVQLNDDQRRRLAAKAKGLGRQALDQIATIVTPDTLMRWYRRLIALKWTYDSKPGRRGVIQEIRRLIALMATENAGWGYRRIQGALENLGHRVARSTVAKVLQENGIKPAPDRRSSWKVFLKAHWGQVAGMDFFTTEVWTARGLVTYYVLFVIDLKTRRVHFAAMTPHPDGSFMAQVARNLTDVVDGFLSAHRLLILDRDTKFTAQFKRILKEAGALRALDQRRVPRALDLLRRATSGADDPRVRGALPSRTEPPGDRERADRGGRSR